MQDDAWLALLLLELGFAEGDCLGIVLGTLVCVINSLVKAWVWQLLHVVRTFVFSVC